MFPSFTAKMRGVSTARTNGASTIAEGIAVKEVGEHTYAIARPLIDEVLLLEEPYFERGIALYCNVEKTVTEGAGAASLAGLLAYPERFRGKKCGLVITGGNIDTRLLASVLTRELVRESRIVSLRVIGDDRPGLLANVSAVSQQLSGVVADNEAELAPALERLNNVTRMLERNRDNLAKMLPGAAKYYITQGEIVANGAYYNALVPNIQPAQLLQPFLDYAFGFRRGANAGQPPDNAGPRAEVPFPVNGIPQPGDLPDDGNP